jgi:hypothetical protein
MQPIYQIFVIEMRGQREFVFVDKNNSTKTDFWEYTFFLIC